MSSKTTSAICWENNILFKKVHILGLELKKIWVFMFCSKTIHFLKQNIIFSTGGACLRTHKLL